MRKKGVEMSLNVIIIAAIGLLILVILAFLVIKNVSRVPETQQKSCNLNGGACVAAGSCSSTPIANTDCTGEKPVCCKITG